jgi:uncharacterized membrane protein YdjX (TVP38/TMEM64 family)
MWRYRRLLLLVAFIGLLLGVFELSGLRGNFTVDALHDALVAHPVSGLLVFVALFSLGNLLHIPGLIFLAAAVLALGRVAGGAMTYVAACVSCVLSFSLVRLLGGDALRRIRWRLAGALMARLDAQPVRSVLVLRLLFQTLPTLNYVLALSGVRFRSHLVGTLLGLPLPIAVYCVFFDQLAGLLHLH